MGKKVKVGKQRKDKYYGRAKCAGYRARSSYKLIQLNKKYEFLEKSRVCIDLCAAPGSWMQVAQQYMPVSSFIVGVDRFKINPIHGCVALQGDITTDKLRQDLRATLKTWKADVVLHDGAPSMGKNWLYDAYQQNLLTLHAFKLACEFLQKGGWFVSKVFRSKDYFKLDYIFKKLFKKVEATKPSASRYESAEIFVVCQGFLAPDKIDPEFFNPTQVFSEQDLESKPKINLLKSKQQHKEKAEGYEDGATIIHKTVPVSKFIHSNNFMEVLQGAWTLEFDDEGIRNHPLTTPDIVENCKDIKVLGKKDLRQLLMWRKKLEEELTKDAKEKEKLLKGSSQAAPAVEPSEEEMATMELDKVQQQILELKAAEALGEKKALKKKRKELKRLQERIRLKTLIPGDSGPTDTSTQAFSLAKIKALKNVDDILDKEAEAVGDSDDDIELPKYKIYARGEIDDEFGDNREDPESDEELEETEGLALKVSKKVTFDESAEGEGTSSRNPLLTDLVSDNEESRRAREAESFFSRDIFKDIENEEDEDYGLGEAVREFKAGGGELYLTKEKAKKKKEEAAKKKEKQEFVATDAPDTSDEESGIDMDKDEEDEADSDTSGDEDNTEVGPKLRDASNGSAKKRKGEDHENLDAVGLALATKMMHSKKAKRDITDAAWNRYMYGDEDLPDWFAEDENKYNSQQVDVDPADLKMYQEREAAVNSRTLKKVVEAKARKQRRVKRRLDKAKKKVESITNHADMTAKEKVHEVKKLYKTAMKPLQKKERKYVVMKKKDGGTRPSGTKGPTKIVDKRMKKDTKGKLRSMAKKNGKGGRRSGHFSQHKNKGRK